MASPLAPIADLVLDETAVPSFPLLLSRPAPRAGIFWSAGNPAALPFELRDSYTEFRTRASDERGAYRRPLDAASTREFEVSGGGWRPVGSAGAVSGSVSVARSSDGGIAADVGQPYSMSPHLFVDTSRSSLGQTVVRLDGAGGWRIGGWGLGVAAAYESQVTRTGTALVPRFQRGVLPAVTAGASRRLGSRVLLGAHVRWQGPSQTLSVSTRGTGGLVYVLAGYTEPTPINLGPRDAYNRRIDRDAEAAGLGASVDAVGVRWVATGEVTRLHERQTSQASNHPPVDHWDANGYVLGLWAQTGPHDAERGLRLVAGMTWTHVSGDAVRAGLKANGILFHASVDRLSGSADLRFRPAPRWTAGARIAVGYGTDRRDDLLARIGSSLRTWSPAFALEVACDASRAISLSGGAGVAWSTPIGSIPDPASQGSAYRQWLAPALSYDATPGRSHAVRFSARWRSAGGSQRTLEVQYAGAAARHAAYQLPFAPASGRARWQVALSMSQ